MKTLSYEENKILSGLARIEVRRWSSLPDKQYMVDLMNIALNTLEQQLGWIDWKGDMALPPVGNDVMVETRLRSGSLMQGLAKTFRWRNHTNQFGDIIAYRMIENDGREG
jgi:hypothetical protein